MNFGLVLYQTVDRAGVSSVIADLMSLTYADQKIGNWKSASEMNYPRPFDKKPGRAVLVRRAL